MGLYDELDVGVKCPGCGRAIVPQTTLTSHPYLRKYRAGDTLDFGDELFIGEGWLAEDQECGLGKSPDQGCGLRFTVRLLVRDNRLTGEWSVVRGA